MMNRKRPADQRLKLRLREAILRNDVRALRKLCSKGVDVNEPLECRRTPLSIGAHAGHTQAVEALCARGADPNKKDDQHDGWIPLTRAAQNRDIEMIKVLCRNGADVNGQRQNGQSALSIAIDMSDPEMVKTVCALGASVNKTEGSYHGHTPLTRAADRGDAELVRLLCSHGADVTKVSASGLSPLMAALTDQKLDIIRILCDCGADVREPWGYPWKTPLEKAVLKNMAGVAQFLLARGADAEGTSTYDGAPFIVAAARSGCVEIVSVLSRHGVEVNKTIPGLTSDTERAPLASALTLVLQHMTSEYSFDRSDETRVSTYCDCIKCLLSAGVHIQQADLRLMGSPKVEPLLEKQGVLECAKRCGRPTSLKRLCKFAIRLLLAKPLAEHVSRLGLPEPLQKYVLLQTTD